MNTPVTRFNAPLLTIHETRDLVEQTIASVYDAVVATMGPNGQYAFISIGDAAKVTKDGVTVAKAIQFDDPRQEVVNRIITEPAIKTDDECGDGTTTTILLTVELTRLFMEHNNFFHQRLLEEAVYAVIDTLVQKAIHITPDDIRLLQMAITSANGDDHLARQVVHLYQNDSGRFPEIELKESGGEDRVVVTDGISIQMHYANPAFSLQGNGSESTFENFYPVIVDAKLSGNEATVAELVTLVKTISELEEVTGPRTLVIIARSIENELCGAMSQINGQKLALKNPVRVVGLNLISGGSMATLILQDVSAMLGCGMATSLEQATSFDHQISTVSLKAGMGRTVLSNFTDERRTELNLRADQIQSDLDAYEYADRFSVRAKLNRLRIQKLRGQLITIFVGGETNSEIKERIDRFEDVVKAVKSALTNGILPGVGTSLIYAAREALGEYRKTVVSNTELTINQHTDLDHLLLKLQIVMAQPYRYLMEQVMPGQVTVSEKLETFDLATGRRTTPEEAGIYDTAYATITALRGGVQTAKILSKASSIHLGAKLNAVKSR